MIDHDGPTDHGQSDPLNPKSREPNFIPPTADPAFLLHLPGGIEKHFDLPDLQEYPRSSISDCYIVSTGHSSSGPFVFSGVALIDFIDLNLGSGSEWNQVEVISADDFGVRISFRELVDPDPAGPITIADARDGILLTRSLGLFRLIVPSERDDAIRQVKWIRKIRVLDG